MTYKGSNLHTFTRVTFIRDIARNIIPEIETTSKHSHLLDALFHIIQHTYVRKAHTRNHLTALSYISLLFFLVCTKNFVLFRNFLRCFSLDFNKKSLSFYSILYLAPVSQ